MNLKGNKKKETGVVKKRGCEKVIQQTTPSFNLLGRTRDRKKFRGKGRKAETVRSVSHFVYEFVEFVIVVGHGQSPILSNKTLDKLDVTTRLLL
jgi:hypothetical protein